MKSSRLQRYLNQSKKTGTDPIKRKSDVKDSHDKHIDQDFEGFPDGPSKEEVIKPKTATQKKTAAVDVKDGEKKISTNKKGATNSDEHTGSGGAFEATESVKE